MDLLKHIRVSIFVLVCMMMPNIVHHANASEPTLQPVADDVLKAALGSDADADGVRDDVAEYLNKKYSERPHVKRYALDYSHFMQQQIEHVNDRDMMLKVYTQSLINLNCLRNAIANPVLEQQVRAGLDGVIFNTDVRSNIQSRLQEHIKSYSNLKTQTSYECVKGELLQ